MKPNRLSKAMWIVTLLCMPCSAWAQSNPGTVPATGMLPPTIPIFPLEDVVLFPNIPARSTSSNRATERWWLMR